MSYLAANDACEIHFRRLAAYKYQVRTGDKSGAQFMLAVKPPGASTDIAPTWMVADATLHSKAEFQRGQRVHGWGGKPNGPKGGGKGDKDKGKGDKNKKGKKGQWQQGGAAAGAQDGS